MDHQQKFVFNLRRFGTKVRYKSKNPAAAIQSIWTEETISASHMSSSRSRTFVAPDPSKGSITIGIQENSRQAAAYIQNFFNFAINFKLPAIDLKLAPKTLSITSRLPNSSLAQLLPNETFYQPKVKW